MNKKSKIALAATAALATGALGIAIPALAHDRGAQSGDAVSEGFVGERHQAPQDHNHVTLSATITDVPADITNAREVHDGAYFTVALLDATATEAPADLPADAHRRISIRPTMADDGTLVEPTLENGTLTGDLGLRAPLGEGTTKLGLYPSDRGAPVLVTIEVDADGNATVTASAPLSLSYSADVAAEAPEMGLREGRGGHGGHRGGHGPRGDHDHDADGNDTMGGFEVEAPAA